MEETTMIPDLVLTSIETISAFELSGAGGAYKWTLDELQNATVAQSQETQDVTGRQGRLLNTLKRNKSVTISATNGLVSGGLLETQTGGTFSTKTTQVLWTDYLTVNASHKATTTYTAVGTAGAEIEALYIRNADGSLGAKLEQAGTAAAGKFAYAPATKELTFHTDVAENTEVIVFYKRQISADVLENRSENYSGKAALYIDALAEDNCSNVYHVQIYVPKADFSGEFSLEFGDSQAVHSFEATAQAGACGNADYLWTYTVFGENTADA
jgi:hypothetical protein